MFCPDKSLLLTEFRESLQSKKCQAVEEDAYLYRFLQAKNMDLQKALDMFTRYHDMKRKNSELFSKMIPNELKHVYEQGIVSKLPGTDLEGRAIFIFRFANWDTKLTPMDDVYLACVLLLEEMSFYPEIQERGVVMIHDYEGFEFSHFRQMTFRNFLRILQIMQGSFPLKFKSFHEVNQPSLFYILYKVFYPLVSQKLRKRIFMHGRNMESLLMHISSATLPVCLGGSGDETDLQFMENLFRRNDYYTKLLPV